MLLYRISVGSGQAVGIGLRTEVGKTVVLRFAGLGRFRMLVNPSRLLVPSPQTSFRVHPVADRRLTRPAGDFAWVWAPPAARHPAPVWLTESPVRSIWVQIDPNLCHKAIIPKIATWRRAVRPMQFLMLEWCLGICVSREREVCRIR